MKLLLNRMVLALSLLFLNWTALSSSFSGPMMNLQSQPRSSGGSREIGSPVGKWIQDPLGIPVVIAVSNLYADRDAYLELKLAGETKRFYGAGVDALGNYIPTNYPPIDIKLAARREYSWTLVCTNSGPAGSPFFKLGDFWYPQSMVDRLVNSNAPTLVSQFVWDSFSAAIQSALTNSTATWDEQQTNLVSGFNNLIQGPSIYDEERFGGITLSETTSNLLVQMTLTGADLRRLNRLLLSDAYGPYGLFNTAGTPDNSGTADIQLSVKQPLQPDINKLKAPQEYSILTNRLVFPDFGIVNLFPLPDSCVSTNGGSMEVVKERFAHWKIEDGCDDPAPSAGDGTWLSLGPGGTADTNRIGIDWSVSLGRLFDGLAAGRLRLREPALEKGSYTPSAIYYNAASTNVRSQVLLVTTNAEGVLRQIKAFQTFVDVLAPDTNQTVLNFYFPDQVGTNRDENGVFTNINGTPFVTWNIQNPEPASTNKLFVIEMRNGTLRTNRLSKAGTPDGVRWELRYGTGTEERVEIRSVAFAGQPVNVRRETNTIAYGGSASPAYYGIETYQYFPWGVELAEVRIPGPSDQVTTYAYYSDPSNQHSYGKLHYIQYPDGYWEKRIYEDLGYDGYPPIYYMDGLLRYVMRPRLDECPNPLEAVPANSEFEVFEYAYPGAERGTSVFKYDGAAVTQELSGTHNVCFEVPEGEGKVLESMSQTYDHSREGQRTSWNCVYDSSLPPGLADHTFAHVQSGQLGSFYYYDHGTYATGQFSMNLTNHLYNGSTHFPAHRETRLTALRFDRTISDSVTFNAVNASGDLAFWISPVGDVFGVLEDHPLRGEPWVGLFPGQTRKTVRIFSQGNMVQQEEYVYAGLTGAAPRWGLLYTDRYDVDSLGRTTNITRIDPVTSVSNSLYSADYRGQSGYDGPLLLSEINETGAKTLYTYDGLRRPKLITTKGFGGQPDRVTILSYDALGQRLKQIEAAGGNRVQEIWAYDLAGRQTNHVSRDGIATRIVYSADGRSRTTVLPGGVSMTASNYLDRKPKSLTGTAGIEEFYEHAWTVLPYEFHGWWVYGDKSALQQTTHFGSPASLRRVTTSRSVFGTLVAEEQPNTTGGTNWAYHFYSNGRHTADLFSKGRPYVVYLNDSAGVVRLKQTRDMSEGIGARSSLTDQYYIEIGNAWFLATTNWICEDPLYTTLPKGPIESIELMQINGLEAGVQGRQISYDASTNETVTTTYLDPQQNRITVVSTCPAVSSLAATKVFQSGLLQSYSTFSVSTPIRLLYDGLGRTNGVQDALGFTSSMTYSQDTGWLLSTADSAGNLTAFQYYTKNEQNAGKIKCITAPTGKKTYYSYTPRGELHRTWGDIPYPVEYRYDEYGSLTNMITFRGGQGWTGSSWPANPGVSGDNTFWVYHAASGALLEKVDHLGRKSTFRYEDETGRLLTRSWQRSGIAGLVTRTNRYAPIFGDLAGYDYNDGTPSITLSDFSYHGNPRRIIDATGTNTCTYDHAGRLVSISCTNGTMLGITVSNHYTAALGRDVLSVDGVFPAITHEFGYDPHGRLDSVWSGDFGARYAYLPNSDLLHTTSCYSDDTEVLVTTRHWEYGMRLHGIANEVPGVGVASSHNYAYDSANRRTQAHLEDGSVWTYGYNDRDELTSANRFWNDWEPYSGQQFAYGYDNIGNRQKALVGGDKNGANLREVSYSANSLNQYTQVLTPGAAHIAGLAFSTNTVTVNSGLTERRGEWFDREISITNTNSALWQQVSISDGLVSSNGGFVFPRYDQQLAYDLDGNLIADGLWTYEWDAENRLKAMTMTNTISSLPTAQRKRLEFAYDFMGRRFSKVVKTWNGSTFASPVTNLFVYDGWNLIATMNPAKTVLASFMWGQDLSGTMTEAGGVGGLLAMLEGANAHFAAYDGNGNVTGLVKSDRTISARYEYSPYGELLRATGPQASLNPFRFSTRFADQESGLVYYGCRYYSPALGRWFGRDQAEEHGGLNLSMFCKNAPINFFDAQGCTPQQLGAVARIGLMAGYTDALFNLSSFLSFPGVNLGMNGTMVQGMAVGLSIAIDAQLGGRLLRPVGGAGVFLGLYAAGTAAGYAPRFNKQQSLAAAVVAGRLSAVAAIGGAAMQSIGGISPNDTAKQQAAMGFLTSARRGDTAYADLDAALLGLAIGEDVATDDLNVSGMAWDLLNGDAAGAFSRLGSYQALNAWDMAIEMEDYLEGM